MVPHRTFFLIPGFDDVDEAADVASMADAVHARIAEAGSRPCIVVGHSMSAKAATVLAAPKGDHALPLENPRRRTKVSRDSSAALNPIPGTAGAATNPSRTEP